MARASLWSCFLLLITQVAPQYSQYNEEPFPYRGHPHDDDHHDHSPIGRRQTSSDPCLPRYHRLINNQPQRSYNYRFGSGPPREQALCDRDLTPGWYRFHSLAGSTIPTSCPGTNYCGTRAPVWMKGNLPGVDEGITKAIGCVSVQGKCCTTQIPMLVKNCTDFVVYHLQPTEACPSAYCAGYEVPCPSGLSSDTGYTPCHFPVDLLESKVSFGVSRDGSQIRFFCDVTLGGNVVPESLSLEVEWLGDDEVIQSESFGLLQQHKGVLKEDKWSIGQVLQCRARARHATINTFTPVVTSPPFNTGILILNSPTLSAQEGQHHFLFLSPQLAVFHLGAEPVFIEFQPTVPITCPKKKKPPKKNKKEKQEEEEEEECCVTFDISTRGPSSLPRCASGNPYDLVILNTCTLKVCADEWNVTQRVAVWALNDGLIGGLSTTAEDQGSVTVNIRTGEQNPPRWSDIVLPPIEVQIDQADVSERCVAGDHIRTFDGLEYSNSIEGTFVLYKHTSLPYEVQLNLKKCNQRPLCNCAVSIRFGDTSLSADICSSGKLKFWGHTTDATYKEPSQLSHLPQIIRIDEGRTFEIKLPTGTRVILGPNLRYVVIQASLPDLYHTSGLCGSFDRLPSNDFATFKGQVVCDADKAKTCEDFMKSWRLTSEHSLFVGSFSNDDNDDENNNVEEGDSPGKCSCSSLKKSATGDVRPKAKSSYSNYPYEEYQPEQEQGEEPESKCHSAQCQDPRGVDVTLQLLELALDEEFSGNEEDFSKKAEEVELKPVFFDSNSSATAVVEKKEWTDETANNFCQMSIQNLPETKLCQKVANLNVDNHLKVCKDEIMYTKSPEWIMDIMEELRWECRDQVFHNLSIWEPQLGRQYGTPPQSVLSSLCLNACSSSGECENGQCRCGKGFGGADCSVNLKLPPSVNGVNQKGVCDIRSKPCSELILWGSKFSDHSDIRCYFDVYKTQNVRSVPVLAETITTSGRALTFQSIICDIPDLPIHDAKIASFYIPGEGLDKTRTLMRVRVSYGAESPPSEPQEYVIYDSLCWICENPLACEARPSQSCNVLSEPFGSDPFPNPSYNRPIGYGSSSQSKPVRQYAPERTYPQSDHDQEEEPEETEEETKPHPRLSKTCLLPKDPGPCKNDNLRYFFDAASLKCRPFIFGGCQGNSNNFQSEDACFADCASNVPIEESGSSVVVKSSPHLSTNFNLFFQTKKEKKVKVKGICQVANNPGSCHDEIVRYYYDTIMEKCRPFIYSGCGGNSNNFKTRDECNSECHA